jgi:Fic family protein
MKYIWERKNWYNFTCDKAQILKSLGELRVLQGKLLGRAASLDIKLGVQAQAIRMPCVHR